MNDTRGIRAAIQQEGGRFESSELATMDEFVDMMNEMARQPQPTEWYEFMTSIKLADNMRQYIYWEGTHYMVFRYKWYLYNRKNGKQTPCEMPESIKIKLR